MSSSTSILDYLGRGTHAARPASPPIGSGTAVYYETDTGNTFMWGGSAWVQISGAGSSTLAGDSDVLITSPANGDLLTYNSTAGKWENQAAGADADTLASDTDVNITSPANGQVLAYNSGTSKWTNQTISSGVSSLAGLSGALTLGSSDSSVTITPSGTNIDLKAAQSSANVNTLAFSSTATGTNFNPNGAGATNYYKATTSITSPTAPFVLRIRAIIKVSSTGVGYVGIAAVKGGATQGSWAGIQTSSGGYAAMYNGVDLNGGAGSTTSGYINFGSLTAGECFMVELVLGVAATNRASAGGNVNGMGSGLAGISTVDFTSSIDVYATGAAATDLVACQYKVHTTALF